MKKKNIIPILVLSLLLVLTFFACGNPSGGGGGGGSPQTYRVTVNGGTGGGNYALGATVTITAAPQGGETFVNWTVNSGNVVLADNSNISTTFTMPANAVTVTANFSNEGDPGCLHDWGEGWQILGAATCAATGQQKRECTLCPRIEVGPIAIDPSNHTGREKPGAITTIANCTVQGLQQILCFDCNELLRNVSLPANPNVHQFGTIWTVDVIRGNERTNCTGCGALSIASRPLSTVPNVTAYLTHTGNNGTLASPLSLVVGLPLGNMTANEGWQQLLGAINSAADYVHLDLAACTMNGTDFNPVHDLETGKNRIVSLILPDAALSIFTSNLNDETFRHFTNLRTVSAEKLTTIGTRSFYNLTSLTSVHFPAVTNIGYGGFQNSTNLASVNFPALTTLGGNTFEGCTNLSNASFLILTTISSNAHFIGNTSLRSLNLPAVTSIAQGNFRDSNNLENITIAANATVSNENQSARFAAFATYYNNAGGVNRAAGIYTWANGAWTLSGMPGAPTNFTAMAASSSSIQLSWGAAQGATQYIIQRSTNASFTVGLTQLTATGTSYTDSGLAGNTQYHYRIQARNAVGTNPNQLYATARTLIGAPPPPPTGLRIHSTSATHISIEWNAALGATSYRVEQAALSTRNDTTSNTSFYRQRRDQYESIVRFRVYSINQNGESQSYAEVTGIMEPAPPAPISAPSVTAAATPGGIALSWTAVPTATWYRIDRSTGSSGPFNQVTITSSNAWTDANVSSGTTYYYRVYAGNSGGQATVFGSASATAQLVSLIGVWRGTAHLTGSTYVFGENGYLSLNGVTFYTWHVSANNIVVSYQGTVAATVPYSISGNNLTLSGNSNVLVAGTYTR